jgi:hypothetical protein
MIFALGRRLAKWHLFTTPPRYVFPSEQIGIDTNFKDLATEFSSSTGFGKPRGSPGRRSRLFLPESREQV